MIRRPPRSTQSRSSAASDVYKRQQLDEALSQAVRGDEPEDPLDDVSHALSAVAHGREDVHDKHKHEAGDEVAEHHHVLRGAAVVEEEGHGVGGGDAAQAVEEQEHKGGEEGAGGAANELLAPEQRKDHKRNRHRHQEARHVEDEVGQPVREEVDAGHELQMLGLGLLLLDGVSDVG
eukprot:TRINITY_DN23075_c0_g1_i1.p1 TRINITY_DN23075_c0_g1~~TRINITY_DN23075_c0_g1_i1.p1  ORF type:complete len:177 (+),score=57.43 TRINITY_DN23075_c0_g1_i1:107-637(+)